MDSSSVSLPLRSLAVYSELPLCGVSDSLSFLCSSLNFLRRREEHQNSEKGQGTGGVPLKCRLSAKEL